MSTVPPSGGRPRRRNSRPRRRLAGLLLPPGVEAWLLKQAYYAVLGEDEQFQHELTVFAFTHGRFCAPDPRGLPDWTAQALAMFAAKWKLPRATAVADLAWSFNRATSGAPLALEPRPVSWVQDSRTLPAIMPVVAPIIYRPDEQTPAWLRRELERRVRRLRSDIRTQAAEVQAILRERGYRPLSPRHRREPARLRLARRLYRHAVLGWTYETIAEAEGSYDAQTVGRSVRRWAAHLDVPLPPPPPRS